MRTNHRYTDAVTITLPVQRNPDSGLVFTQGTWRCYYTTDGKRRQRSLGTTDRARAREARDAFYAELRAQGATETTRRPDPVAADGRQRYVYERRQKPFYVRLPGGRYIGEYDTREEADAAAREALDSLNVNIQP